MNNDEAREIFKKLGLSYEKISQLHVRMLSNMVEAELITYLASGDFHAAQMNMRVSAAKVKDSKFEKGKLQYCYMKVDGSYFKGREAISFNKDGFIGFGGELSSVNTEPILKAFWKWCNMLTDIVESNE
ncbi:hypothetical protein [Clostridium sp. CF012]|uniref:hypothetical protein n=1 Tax=Clostridium sp. CF012 TaxID=2843319 RepID=UPI001C0B4357|nr:hypothetical protein [Clostridium sp. CF012]MBU3145748.1 hypothetical protein [Clostridium sp. CF012]